MNDMNNDINGIDSDDNNGLQGTVTEDTDVSDGVATDDLEPTEDELAAMAGDDSEEEAKAVTVAPTPQADKPAPKGPPAYEAFVSACEAHARALGLSVKEQKGFYQFAASTGHRLYVAKQGRGVTRIDTTLPRQVLAVNGRDISLPLSKPNGRVACHIDPTVESVNAALEILASYQAKIDPPRKATKSA